MTTSTGTATPAVPAGGTNLIHTIYGWWERDDPYTYTVEFWNAASGLITSVASGITGVSYGYDVDPSISGVLYVYPIDANNKRHRGLVFPIAEPACLPYFRWVARAAMNDTEQADNIDIQYPETPKWQDAELDTYIREAIQVFNMYQLNELHLEATLGDLNDGTDTLPTGTVIRSILYYDTRFNQWVELPKVNPNKYRQYRRCWDFINGDLKLYGFDEDGDDDDLEFQIEYKAPFTIPYTETALIDVPKQYWEILIMYVEGKCHLRLESQDAQLSRWREEGKRNDSPITPIAKHLIQEANRRMASIRLPRLIRKRRR